jgi:hypothetical protein
MTMKYIRKDENGNIIETWDGQPSTHDVSNFYLLPHASKVAMGWEKVEEPVVVIPEIYIETKKEQRLQWLNALATEYILRKYPTHEQVNAALGIYDGERKGAIVSEIVRVRNKVHSYQTLIQSATTEQELDFDIGFD